MRTGVPLFALFAVASPHAMLLLQATRDVTPLGQLASLEDQLQQAVLLLSPRTLLSHCDIFLNQL